MGDNIMTHWRKIRKRIGALSLAVVLVGTSADFSVFAAKNTGVLDTQITEADYSETAYENMAEAGTETVLESVEEAESGAETVSESGAEAETGVGNDGQGQKQDIPALWSGF